MLQCLHVVFLEPDAFSGMFLKRKSTIDLMPFYDVNLF